MTEANSSHESFAFEICVPTKIYFGAGEVARIPAVINRHYDSAPLLHDSAGALAEQVGRVGSLLKDCCALVDTISIPDEGAVADNVTLISSSIKRRPEIIVALG